jgi:hypothetical protein
MVIPIDPKVGSYVSAVYVLRNAWLESGLIRQLLPLHVPFWVSHMFVGE